MSVKRPVLQTVLPEKPAFSSYLQVFFMKPGVFQAIFAGNLIFINEKFSTKK